MTKMAEEDESLYDLEFRSKRGRSTTRTTRGVTPSRSVRATSVFPADLRHFDALGEAEGELYENGFGYSNSGLHRARRALSEARIIARDISMSQEREKSVYESIEKTKSKKSSLSMSQSASSAASSFGNYKITVTPRAEQWSSFPGSSWSSRSVTAALLAKYNPTQFPDFIFGTYGPGNKLSEPISSTLKYYGRSILDDYDGAALSSSRNYRGQSGLYEIDSSELGRSYELDSSSRNYRAKSVVDRSAYELDSYNALSSSSYDKLNSRSAAERANEWDFDTKSAKNYRAKTVDRSASALEKNSAAENYYDGIAKAYGLNSASARSARASSVGRKDFGEFEMDEASRGYFEKYAVDLEAKAKKYYDEEESDFIGSGRDGVVARLGSRGPSVFRGTAGPLVRATSQAPAALPAGPGFGYERTGPGTKALRVGDKIYEYPDSTRDSTNIVRPSPLSKFYHYYIPKHYSATPMLGGFMVPAGSRDSKYGWKY